MGKKIKIAKLAVFNIYGSEQINDLFDRVDDFEEKVEHVIHTTDTNVIIARLDDKISDLQHEVRKLSGGKKASPVITLNSDKEISELDTRLTNVEQIVNRNTESINSSDDRISELEKIVAKLLSNQQDDDRVKQLEEQNRKQENKISLLSDQIHILSEEIERLKRIIDGIQTPQTSSESVLPPQQASQPQKKTFQLPVFTSNENVSLITDSTEHSFLVTYLEKCTDISNILDVIKNSDIDEDDKAIYKKLMNSYKKNITKSLAKLKIDTLEDYEISEAIVTAVGENVKDIITSKLILCLCERLRNGSYQYHELLDSINSYLCSIGFYTEVIKVGEKITDRENSIHMDTIYEKTDDKSKHGIISEIDAYPYLINFIDEDENPSVFVCKGSCVVYRFE